MEKEVITVSHSWRESFGEWYPCQGQEMIDFIKECQHEAHAASPGQDVQVCIYSGYNNKIDVELRWERPVTEEEKLRKEHSSLMDSVRSLIIDRRVFEKYHNYFPKQAELDAQIEEAKLLEAQLKMMNCAVSNTVKSTIEEYSK